MFCFIFVFILSLKPRPFVQSFFDVQAPRQPHVFFSFFLFVVLLEMSLSSSIFCTIAVLSLYGEYAVRFSLPDGVFYLLTTGCIFYISLCENSIKNK